MYRDFAGTTVQCVWIYIWKPNSLLKKGQVDSVFNPLNMKRRLLYLKTQFVPRSKHFSSRL